MSEFRNPNGSGNNPLDPTRGETHTQLLRFSNPDYGDGISSLAGADRPVSREISNAIFDQKAPEGNEAGFSNFLWMWGQFIDHDLSLTESGLTAERANMPVPTGDLMFDPLGTGESQITFTRSAFDPETGTDTPRQQVNEITPFIDASSVYGSDAERLAALREEGGKLKVSEGDLLPFNVDGLPNAPSTAATLFLAGDVRANENVGLLSLHTLFVREHNRLVDELADQHPDWDDETLFQEARSIVEAQLQIITYNEFLPVLLGDNALSAYDGYDETVDPQIANEFSTAAFRLGHTMLPTDIRRTQENGEESQFGDLQLRDAFFRPDRVVNEGGIDELLRGAAVQEAEELDSRIIDDVRNFLFGPPGAGGFDLAALNIQRGRDHGLDDYNAVREAYGLARVETFSEITSDPDLQAKLEALYGSVDNIDVFVGGLSEDKKPGSMLGELFHTIIKDQFERVRDGDSFWHETRLSAEQLEAVKGTTLADIIMRNSDVDIIQRDVFSAFDRIGGTDGDDMLRANGDQSLMIGMEGDDRLHGNDGIEEMHGGVGNDRFYARGGDDYIRAGAGNDVAYGDDGDDELHGEEGQDRLVGGNGNDLLDGGDDSDTLFGSRGNDILQGGNGDDALYGGSDDDVLDGGDGNDLLHGGRGADRYIVSSGEDTIIGFDTNEDALDFLQSDTVSSLDDLVVSKQGRDLVLSDAAGNSTTLKNVSSFAEVEAFFREEPTEVDAIRGGPGDVLKGTAGDDLFLDTEGNQIMLGQDGTDTVILEGSRDDYNISSVANGNGYLVWNDAGYDFLWKIEMAQFDNETVELDELV